jgi:polysaccharide export outer membrane protein
MLRAVPVFRGWAGCICLGVLLASVSPVILGQQATAPAPSADSLQTAQQANARLEELAKEAARHPLDATIGPGDLIHVDVFDVPDLSRDVRVSMSGEITLPLIPGAIHVGGLTPFQAQDDIAKKLLQNGLVTHPQVSVMMKEQHGASISVLGAVSKPGVYQEPRPMTVLEALALAGGLAPDAGSVMMITRPARPAGTSEAGTIQPVARGGTGASTPTGPSGANGATEAAASANATIPPAQTITVDVEHLLESGESAYNIPVYGGDILTVPHAGIVYVAGAVNQAGGFVLPNSQDHMSILRAMALAHGTTLTAKLNQSLIIRKTKDGKEQQVNVRLGDILSQKKPDEPLYANDILLVPDSNAKRAFYKAANAAVSVTTGLLIFR